MEKESSFCKRLFFVNTRPISKVSRKHGPKVQAWVKVGDATIRRTRYGDSDDEIKIFRRFMLLLARNKCELKCQRQICKERKGKICKVE